MYMLDFYSHASTFRPRFFAMNTCPAAFTESITQIDFESFSVAAIHSYVLWRCGCMFLAACATTR